MNTKLEVVSSAVETIVKAIVGVAVAIGAFVIQSMYSDIEQMKLERGDEKAEIAVLKSESKTLNHRLERIEGKLDAIWSEVRK